MKNPAVSQHLTPSRLALALSAALSCLHCAPTWGTVTVTGPYWLVPYQLALGDVEIADAKLAEVTAKADATGSEKYQAQHVLLNKKIAANQAARKAGVSEPYAIP